MGEWEVLGWGEATEWDLWIGEGEGEGEREMGRGRGRRSERRRRRDMYGKEKERMKEV